MTTPALFRPLELRGVRFPNRIMLSPMCQYVARDGLPGDWHVVHLGRYAAAGLGLVMAEATHVSPEGRITPGCLGLWSDAQEAAFARIRRFVGEVTATPMGLQLAHAGRKGSTAEPWNGGKSLFGELGWDTVAPSALPHAEGWRAPEALDAAGLATVKADFVASTERAARAGLDVAELHAAHGYLLHQFLSPVANRRTDSYGGTLAARMRFPLEVVEAVRRAWPADKPLFVRISATDWIGLEGWDLPDALAFCAELKAIGVDLVDVSSGGVAANQRVATGPGYQVRFAAEVRRRTALPVAAVGLITEPHQANRIVEAGEADVVALGRALLNDPFWAWRAADALGGAVEVPNSYLRGRRLGADVPRELKRSEVAGVA
jgi:NADPH2 dehydrogenase